jgi:hypothetical protein
MRRSLVQVASNAAFARAAAAGLVGVSPQCEIEHLILLLPADDPHLFIG